MANPSSTRSNPARRIPGKSPAPDNRARRLPTLYFAACGLILLIAAAARICAARNDLWLDEILALELARPVAALSDIFTNIHSEVNHHLYTVYLYLVDPRDNELLCRLPSLVSGIGTVIVAWLIGRRRSPVCAVFSLLMVGCSYVLVLYSSEARGYSLAAFFSFLSFYLLDSYLEAKKWRTALFFSLAVVAGLVSQLTFVSFYLAALAWSGYRIVSGRLGAGRAAREMFACHAVPVLFLAVFYFVEVRYITGIGGTPAKSLIDSYGTALAWSWGAPLWDPLKLLACVAAVAMLSAGIQLLRREKSDSYLFFLGAILAFPATSWSSFTVPT